MSKDFWKTLGAFAAVLICAALVQVSMADDTAAAAPEAILNAVEGGNVANGQSVPCPGFNGVGICDNGTYYYCAVGIWWQFDCNPDTTCADGFNCEFEGPYCP